jgi:Fe-Mn family superoxide dismutase
MSFTLPPLPFSSNALAEAGMCQETLELHHGKHHQAYVTALNGLVDNNPALQGRTLDDIVRISSADPSLAAVFNNAGQHWNHILFWQALSPGGGRMPAKLAARIDADFGSQAGFKEAFKAASIAQFGSGWSWLVQDETTGRLKICRSANGGNPLATGEGRALLGLDLWEHSYYLDFRNRRPDYVTNFLDRLANYDHAEASMLD